MLLLVLCDLKATDYSIPISAWRELLSTMPATGTGKTQSTVPPMNKAETSIVRIPVRMMLDLLLEHLGLHKAIRDSGSIGPIAPVRRFSCEFEGVRRCWNEWL
nr:uncharacterized protein LOC123497310 [Aegilops tauschii subsp. strangulata]